MSSLNCRVYDSIGRYCLFDKNQTRNFPLNLSRTYFSFIIRFTTSAVTVCYLFMTVIQHETSAIRIHGNERNNKTDTKFVFVLGKIQKYSIASEKCASLANSSTFTLNVVIVLYIERAQFMQRNQIIGHFVCHTNCFHFSVSISIEFLIVVGLALFVKCKTIKYDRMTDNRFSFILLVRE